MTTQEQQAKPKPKERATSMALAGQLKEYLIAGKKLKIKRKGSGGGTTYFITALE